MKKGKKKLGKKEKEEIERKELENKFSNQYLDDVSSIDYKKLDIGVILSNPYAELPELEKIIGKPLPRIPKSEYIDKKIVEEKKQRLKNPTGIYRDEEKVIAIHQQKFMEYTATLCPEVIEDLQVFVSHFDSLFPEKKENFIGIFDRRQTELFDLNYSLTTKIDFYIIDNPYIFFRPNFFEEWKSGYNWGEYELLFHVLYFLFVDDGASQIRNKYALNMQELIKDGLRFRSNHPNLPQNLNEIDQEIYLIENTSKVILQLFSGREKQLFYQTSKHKLITFLHSITPNPENILADFIILQIELMGWAEKYNLKKDWLLRYAYFFLSKFSENPNIKVKEIEIPVLEVQALKAFPFDFDYPGWSAGDERKEDYEKKLRQAFDNKLKQYFHDVSVDLNLEDIPRGTGKINYDRVKWLVRRVVQGWNKEKIIEEIESEPINSVKERYVDISTIDKAFRQFKNYGLPVEI